MPPAGLRMWPGVRQRVPVPVKADVEAAGDHASGQGAGAQRVAQPPTATNQGHPAAHRGACRALRDGGDIADRLQEKGLQPAVEVRRVRVGRRLRGRNEHAAMTPEAASWFRSRRAAWVGERLGHASAISFS